MSSVGLASTKLAHCRHQSSRTEALMYFRKSQKCWDFDFQGLCVSSHWNIICWNDLGLQVYRYNISYITVGMVDLCVFFVSARRWQAKKIEHHCYHETLCAPILLFFTFLELKGPIESMVSGSSMWHHFALCWRQGRIKMDPSYVFLLWTKLQTLISVCLAASKPTTSKRSQRSSQTTNKCPHLAFNLFPHEQL